MKNLYILLSLIVVLIISVSCEKQKGNDEETVSAVLSLEKLDDHRVSLNFNPNNVKKLPRIADIYLTYDPTQLKFTAKEIGEALKTADKDIFVKEDVKTGTLRITSLSAANLNRIQGGTIAILTFDKKVNENVTVSFDTTKQVFAPAEANEQVTFGSAVEL